MLQDSNAKTYSEHRDGQGAYHLTEKSHQGFQSITVSNLSVYCRILTLVTVSSHLMTNEDRGCQHVAIKSRIKLKNLVLNNKGQIFERSLANV